MKTLVQCDFDGTITEEDISYLLLDKFATADWRQLLTEYQKGRISVGQFNTTAFAMIKADRQTLVEFVKQEAKIRAGFHELLAYCRQKNSQFVIVSNGLDFYINTILRDTGVDNIEVFAARAHFGPEGIEARYIGPDGSHIQDDFKKAHTELFLKKGYRIVYIGNGLSDIPPARLAHHAFATGEMLTHCQEMNLNCIPFNDLNDVIRGMELGLPR